MSGPVSLLQGLCIFPRDVQYSSATGRLTRITEAWLVGENAADGPTAVHAAGLWIGLGLRGAHHSLEVGFGARDGALPTTWTTPSGNHADVDKALRKAFGQNTANWKGFHLRRSDLPAGGPTWDAIFFRVVSGFQPNKPRDFHVVPLIVALAGGTEDTLGDSHYLLGLSVFTESSAAIEDFMVITHAMRFADGHPGVTIPARRVVSPKASKDPGKGASAPPRAQRPAAKPSKSKPAPGRKGKR